MDLVASRRKSSDRWTDALAVIECNRRNWEMLTTNTKGMVDARSKRWISGGQDLLGIFDGMAIPRKGGGIIFLQWTGDSGGNFAARQRKITNSGKLPVLARSGAAVVVWAFRREDQRLREEVMLPGRVPGGEMLVA